MRFEGTIRVRIGVGIRIGIGIRARATRADLTLSRSPDLHASPSVTLDAPWRAWNALGLWLSEADAFCREEKQRYVEDDSSTHRRSGRPIGSRYRPRNRAAMARFDYIV